MAGMDESEVIDLVAQEEDGAALLVIVEARPWSSPLEQGEQLKAKLNTYAQFILDGGLVSHYPEFDGRPATIRLECAMEPPSAIQDILRVAGDRLAEYQLQVTHVVNPRL